MNSTRVVPVEATVASIVVDGAELLSDVPDLHPETDDLVNRFALAMKGKLAMAQARYGFGAEWADTHWFDECRAKLIEHISKGDPRDVANYCAFLWHHGERTSIAAPPTADAQGLSCGEWPTEFIDAKVAEFAPVAWLHQVVGDDGEPDQALSFAPDNFPLQGVVGYRSLSHAPLYLHPTPPQRNDMAQITMGMADGIIAAAAKGQRYPLTANELGQLAHAWKQMYARCPEPTPTPPAKSHPQEVPGE